MKNIFLIGCIGWEITLEKIMSMIDLNSKDDLKIFVHSPGGDPLEAFAIYNYLKLYSGNIEFIILGQANSATSLLIFAGDKISGFKKSIWMIHRLTSCLCGNADEFSAMSNLMLKIESLIISEYMTRISWSEKELKAKMDSEYWAVGADELQSIGLIDTVYDIEDIKLNDPILTNALAEMEYEEEMLLQNAKKSFQNMSTQLLNFENTQEYKAKFLNFAKEIESNTLPWYRKLLNKKEKSLDKKSDIMQGAINTGLIDISNNAGKEFDKMKLNEFLEKYPAAKTEFENLVNSRVNTELEKVSKVLEYEGVQLSNIAVQTLDENLSLENYMDMKLKAQAAKGKQAEKKPKFANLSSGQTPGQQTPDVQTDGKLSDKDYDTQMENFAKGLGGKNG